MLGPTFKAYVSGAEWRTNLIISLKSVGRFGAPLARIMAAQNSGVLRIRSRQARQTCVSLMWSRRVGDTRAKMWMRSSGGSLAWMGAAALWMVDSR